MKSERSTRGVVLRYTGLVTIGCALLAGVETEAAGIFYDDTGGNFSENASWAGGVAPGSGDVAIFNTINPALNIGFIQNNAVNALQVRNDNVTFDLTGTTLNLLQAPPIDSLLIYDPAGGNAAATFTNGKPAGGMAVHNVRVLASAAGTSILTLTAPDFVLSQSATDSFTIGDATGGASTLLISNGATVNAGSVTVNASGTVNLSSDSLLNVSGNILVDGGAVYALDDGNFTWASNKTATVQNGGSLSFTGTTFSTPANASFVVTGTGSTVSGAGTSFDLNNNSQIQVSNGGAWDKSLYVDGGSTVSVDGAGSTLSRFYLIDGSVTLDNGAASSGSIYRVGYTGSAGTGTLNIHDDASLTASSSFYVSSSSSHSNGVINVDGANATLTTSSNSTIGSSVGSTGTVSLTNGGTYNMDGDATINATGTINVGSNGVLNNNGAATINGGLIEVSSGGDLNLNNTLGVSGGTLRINDGAQLNALPATQINVTHNGQIEFTDTVATINLNDGNNIDIDGVDDGAGAPSTLHAYDNLDVTHNTWIQADNGGALTVDDDLHASSGGVVSVSSDAMLNVTDNITVDGGTLTSLRNSNFSWPANKTMAVSGGGTVYLSSSLVFDGAQLTVDGAGSQVTGSGTSTSLTNASSISLTNGGHWTKSVNLFDGSTVVADGPGTELGTLTIADGTATLTNGAFASGPTHRIGYSGGISTATLNILNGSTFESTYIGFNVSNAGVYNDGEVNVDGGSSLIVEDADIGSTSGSTGTINLTNSSSYTASGTTTLRATGTINIDNSTALLGDFDDQGGTVNFVSGTFGHNGDFRIGSGSLVGATVNTDTKSMVFGGTVTIDANATVNVNGGIFSAGTLVPNGTLNFTAGRLEITNSAMDVGLGGSLGRTPTIATGQELVVSNDLNVSSIGLLTVDGGSVDAATLNNSGYVRLSGLDSFIDGGTLNNDGVFTGTGLVNASLQNNLAGEVRVDAGNELIFTADGNNNGLIYNDGGNLRFAGNLNNQSAGVISGNGSLRFTGGLTNSGNLNLSLGNVNIYGDIVNDAAGQVSVAGAANTSFFGGLVNNGDVYVGQDSRIVLFGDVSGPGTYSGDGLVEFVGGFSPGASPASVAFQGDVALSGASDLVIELGGLTAGSAFDQLVVGDTIALNGSLDIQLLDNFVPAPGDSFQIIDAASVAGTFSSISTPALPNNMTFDVQYDPTSVTLFVVGGLLPGDLNGDGYIGLDDLQPILDHWNQNVTVGDASMGDIAGPGGSGPDGYVGLDDLQPVLDHWNEGTPPTPPGANVPEPGTGLLMFYLLAAGAGSARRRR